jgi:para-nitrobenzyl esterase
MFLGGPAGQELHELAARMQEAWIAFARTGDRSTEALGEWPAFDPADRSVMRFDVECELLADPGRAELDCWTGLR